MAMDAIPTVLLGLIFILAVVMNIFFLVVFIKRRRLRTPDTLPVSMILVHLACIDLIAAFLWTSYTAYSAATGKWIISDSTSSLYDGLCKQQVYIMTFCNIITGHTLMALMLERFLWIFKPSKRQEIMIDMVVVLFLVSLYIFDGGISSFTLWGFGKPQFFADQHQCAVAYEESVSHFQFTMAMHHWIPITAIVAMFVAIQIRVRILQKRRDPDGVIVLEENLNVKGDSYSDRLKQLYAKIQGAGVKSVKPKVKEVKIKKKNDGFVSDDDDFNSSDEEKSKDDENVMSRDYVETPQKSRERKIYYLSKSDLRETAMYALISAVYFLLWMPYVVRSILYTYYYYDIELQSNMVKATVIMAHLSYCLKVPFYLLSKRLRGAMMKTLGCVGDEKKRKKFDSPHKDGDTGREATTEL